MPRARTLAFRRLTHQGTDVVLEYGLALEEDSAVPGRVTFVEPTESAVEQSTSTSADHLLALQNGFSRGVAETKGDGGGKISL